MLCCNGPQKSVAGIMVQKSAGGLWPVDALNRPLSGNALLHFRGLLLQNRHTPITTTIPEGEPKVEVHSCPWGLWETKSNTETVPVFERSREGNGRKVRATPGKVLGVRGCAGRSSWAKDGCHRRPFRRRRAGWFFESEVGSWVEPEPQPRKKLETWLGK